MFYRHSYSLSLLALAIFLFSASFTSSQSLCQIGTDGVCADDIVYLQCRLQEELHALELLTNSTATPPPNQPLFNDVGQQQCEAFVDRGFCISQPTEMASYCCPSFTKLCSNQTETLPSPPTGNEVLYDDEEAAFVENQRPRATRAPRTTVITTAAPTTTARTPPPPTTMTTTATTTATTTTKSSTAVSSSSATENNETVKSSSHDDFCDFVDAATEMGVVVGGALRENFSFLLNDLIPAISQDAADRLISEEEVLGSDPFIFDPEIDNVRSARQRRMENRRSNRSLQGAVDESVISTEAPAVTPDNSSSSQAEESNANLRTNPTVEGEPLLEGAADPSLSQSDQDVLGILSMLGPGSADLLDSLVPGVNFTGLNYTRVEADLIVYGAEIARRLGECDGCLQPLVDAALDGAFQIKVTSDLPLAQRRRIIKKNEKALIKLTADEFTPRAIKALGRFTDELKVENEQWLSTRTGDLDMDEFIVHSTSALKRVLKEDNLGGLMQNLLPIVGIVYSNLQSPLKAEAIKSNGQKIYGETLECSGGPKYSDESGSTTDGQSGALGSVVEDDGPEVESQSTAPSVEGRRLMTVEGLLGEDLILESWREERMKQSLTSATSNNSQQKRRLQDEEAETGAEVNQGNNDGGSDGWLQGQPCLDRPSEFIASLQRSYGDLNCNELISAVGCEPERFILPFKTIVEACKSTWNIRCGPQSLEEGANDLPAEIVDILATSHCGETLNGMGATLTPRTTVTTTTTTTDQSTTTSTTTTSISETSTTDSSAVQLSLSVVLICLTSIFMFLSV